MNSKYYIISGPCDTGVLYGSVLLHAEGKRLHAGISKFKYEGKNERDSGSREMTAWCKWPIILFLFEEKVYSVFDRCVFIRINFESNVLYLFFCRILNGDNTEWHYAAKYPFVSWDFSYIYIAVDLYTFHSP